LAPSENTNNSKLRSNSGKQECSSTSSTFGLDVLFFSKKNLKKKQNDKISATMSKNSLNHHSIIQDAKSVFFNRMWFPFQKRKDFDGNSFKSDIMKKKEYHSIVGSKKNLRKRKSCEVFNNFFCLLCSLI